MAVAIPNPLIPKLAKALGLNPRKCRSLRLNISTNDIVTADVTEYVDESQLEKVLQCFTPREYVLVPKDAAKWVPVSERLPEVDQRVLVAYDIGYRRGVATGSRITGGTKPYWNVEEIDPRCTEVTAWMLLPDEPPEAK
jgi:hypothetical protein